MHDCAHVDAPRCQLCAGNVDIVDDKLETVQPRVSLLELNAARGAERGELNDAKGLAHLHVKIEVEPDLIRIELLGCVDVTDTDWNDLETPLHTRNLSSERGWRQALCATPADMIAHPPFGVSTATGRGPLLTASRGLLIMSMTFTADESPTAAARRVIDANSYATLATADADGQPWATPVWFAERDLSDFLWVSRTERRHSKNVVARPEVALVVFDSTTPVGSVTAVYAEAVAAVVADRALVDALVVFNAKSVAFGLPEWDESKVSGAAPHRLYRATSSRLWVLDEHEQRIPLS